jgi:hypothetical protein
MDTIILIGIVLGWVGIPVGGSIYVLRCGGKVLRGIIISVLIAAIPLSIFLTHMRVQWNENTFAYGWPVPRVVFQRDAPDGPWLDFIGWTMFLAYPLNYLALVSIPALLSMVVLGFRKHMQKEIKANKPCVATGGNASS